MARKGKDAEAAAPAGLRVRDILAHTDPLTVPKASTLLTAVFADVTDVIGMIQTGLFSQRAIRRLHHCVKKQTLRGEDAEINVASMLRLKPAQTDLVFGVRVGVGTLTTGLALWRKGSLSAATFHALSRQDQFTTQRWGWMLEENDLADVFQETAGGAAVEDLPPVRCRPRVQPVKLIFRGAVHVRHLTNVRFDEHTAYCDTCLKPGARFLLCSRCGVATYCSEPCQRLGWLAGHKAWCRMAAALPRGAGLADTHAVVPRGKKALRQTLLHEDNIARAPQCRQMREHIQRNTIRDAIREGVLPPLTPAQMEKLRRYLVKHDGNLPPRLEDVVGVVGPERARAALRA